MLSGFHCTIWGRVLSQVPGAEDHKVESEPPQFPSNVCSPYPSTIILTPEGSSTRVRVAGVGSQCNQAWAVLVQPPSEIQTASYVPLV